MDFKAFNFEYFIHLVGIESFKRVAVKIEGNQNVFNQLVIRSKIQKGKAFFGIKKKLKLILNEKFCVVTPKSLSVSIGQKDLLFS